MQPSLQTGACSCFNPDIFQSVLVDGKGITNKMLAQQEDNGYLQVGAAAAAWSRLSVQNRL